MAQEKPTVMIWNWRQYFTQTAIHQGESDERNSKLTVFQEGNDGRSAWGKTVGGFTVRVFNVPREYEDYETYPRWDRLKLGHYASGKMAYSKYYSCNCSQGIAGIRCRHLVNLMYHWEKEHGLFLISEDEEKRKLRLEKEAREREKAEKEANQMDPKAFLRQHTQPDPKGIYFSLSRMMDELAPVTNQYEVEIAEKLLSEKSPARVDLELQYARFGEQELRAEGFVEDQRVIMVMSQKRLDKMICGCGRSIFHAAGSFYYGSGPAQKFCAHQLAFWVWAKEAIQQENPGDSTDAAANQLLALMTQEDEKTQSQETAVRPARQKQANIQLSPRIILESDYHDEYKLSFDIRQLGGKEYALRKLEELADAVEEEKTFTLGKGLQLNFAEQTFTEDSQPWFDRILSRVRAIRRLNDNVSLHSGYRYTFSVGSSFEMTEAEWDSTYKMAEGGMILYQWGTRKEAQPVPVRPMHPRAEVTLVGEQSAGRLQSIRMTGLMPQLVKGSQYEYVLNRDGFGRVNPEEIKDLTALRSVFSHSRDFSCVIGERKFAEFCYRVLPKLRASDQILLHDNVSERLQALLPVEGSYTFFVDLEEKLTCRVLVAYGEKEYTLQPETVLGADALRDRDQESRVLRAVQSFFPEYDGKESFQAEPAEEILVRILTDGVETLSRYGTVKGSEAFRKIQFRPAPQVKVSVELADGGLLELSIQTKDLSEQELLELLASYRLRKRWHRLRSGDFVDLSDATALSQLEETAHAMDLTVEELLAGDVHLPKYRALYVDKLLEQHEALAAGRDRHFKSLIRSFQTIRDSDFEPSEALAETLRPYQMYGFRWLSTLASAGFGGILADEMGLGKTIQMLAYLQMERDRGESRPALVVCPASLVYNWQEESKKFTPGLRVEAIAGGLPARKKQIAALWKGNGTDLCITSYDLLKRDVALYDGVTFSTVVLDEAQFIKNQKAQVSRSVRILKAEHRFALTGTPIENRLSELWSIFDFLMPGFLYSSSEFSERYELPVMKYKDAEATEKLSRMTGPFILRRKKTDVLKDLPEKLEEIRTAAMEPDQRRLYDAQVIRMRELLASGGESGEDKMRILAEITRLRQLCCDPLLLFEDYHGSSAKREACLELIQSAIDGGHRMLVFSQFTSMLSLLAEDLKKEHIPFFTITGSTPKQERLNLVNDFNNGDTPVFLISLKAGGTGLNLTGADVVIHYDPWWNLAVQNQATDRAHRIGQTRQVTVMKLIAADSIEERIVQLQETKRDLAEAIISGEHSSLLSLSREELLELLD